MEQIEVRKHWKVKKDPNAMDLDAAERNEPGAPEAEPTECPPKVKEMILIH